MHATEQRHAIRNKERQQWFEEATARETGVVENMIKREGLG